MLGKKGNKTMSIYDEFDSKFDTAGLKKDLEAVKDNKTEYKEVPHGMYEVKITKLELTKSSKGDPMVSIWFKIVNDCDYKNQLIFMNQVINSGFGLHKCNEFLRTISALPIDFESFKQYSMLLTDIMEEIDGKREFQLNYGTNKGFNTFKIEQVFEMQA